MLSRTTTGLRTMLSRRVVMAVSSTTPTVTTMRTFAARAPSEDPLELLRETSAKRNLCDESGYRLKGVHWTLALAYGSDDPVKPPNLRTVGFQRVSDLGIDFVVKKGTSTGRAFNTGCPVSILVQTGRYIPGESAEQWRGEGHCEALPLTDIIEVVPDYTVSHMVASRRIELEEESEKKERSVVESTSHLTEVVQQVRTELVDTAIPYEELADSISAYRFHPDRLELMSGSPDRTLWHRWEWLRDDHGDGSCPEGSIDWKDASLILPH